MTAAGSLHGDDRQVQPETLEGAIRSAIPNIFATTNPALGEKLRAEVAQNVLALPEMTAIRRVLRVLASDSEASRAECYDYVDSHDEWDLVVREFPHLGDWVRSEP